MPDPIQPPNTPPSSSAEDTSEETDVEKKRKAEYDAELHKQTQEVDDIGSTGIAVASIFGSIAADKLAKRKEIIDAFARLNDEDYYNKLLNFGNNKEGNQVFRQLEKDQSLIRQEVLRQKSLNRKPEAQTIYKVGIGPWEQRIDETLLNRKTAAFKSAKTIQGKVEAEEFIKKSTNARREYGLDDKHFQDLQHGFAEWKSQNPKGTIDQYLTSSGVRGIYRDNFRTDSQNPDAKKKSDKEIDKIFYEQGDKISGLNEELHIKTVQEHKEEILNTHKSIQEISDLSKPLATNQLSAPSIERKASLEKVTAPGSSPVTAPPPTSPPTPSLITPAAAATKRVKTITAGNPISRGIAKFLSTVQERMRLVNTKFLAHFSAKAAALYAAQKLTAFRASALALNGIRHFMAAHFKSAFLQGATKFLTSAAFKVIGSAIKAAAALGSLGTTLVIAAVDELMKRLLGFSMMDAGKFALKAAIFGIGAVVFVIIVILFFTLSTSSSLLSSKTSSNPKIFTMDYKTGGIGYNWQEFDKQFLAVTPAQKFAWNEFNPAP